MFHRLLVSLLVVVLLCTGCGTGASTVPQDKESNHSSTIGAPPDGICPKSVMIEGKMYYDQGVLGEDVRVDEDQIMGYITSIVSINTMPQQNNEANYPEVKDAPYARWNDTEYGEVYVIRYDNNWHILLPAE